MTPATIPDPANLPPELLKLKQFIIWREEKRGEKFDKVPCAPWRTGHWGSASVTDPYILTTFDNAVCWAKKRSGYGIGFCFKKEGGIVGLDFDRCINDNKVSEEVSRYVREANSYTELSPSGRGIHIFLKGILPGTITRDEIEAYDRNRFFTLTGHRYINTPLSLAENQDFLDKLWKKYGKKEEPFFVDKNEKRINILTIAKTDKLVRRGKQLQGPHPVHGSNTGFNFSINPAKNTWFCYRHWVGGGPLTLLGIQEGIITCEDLADGKLSKEKYKKLIALAKERGIKKESDEEKITDKYITDLIMSKYLFYCDKFDESGSLYIWAGDSWHNGVAENFIVNELSEIFKNEEKRRMRKEATIDFIKGQAMNRPISPKPHELIAFKNGLLNFKTGELRPHDPNLFYVNVIPHNYDPNAKCPKFLEWLKQVIRPEDMAFFQEWAGYNLYDDCPEPAFVFYVGYGQNGKSIWMELLGRIIGEKNKLDAKLSDFQNNPYQLAEVKGKLAVIGDEVGYGYIKDTSDLKRLASGSMIETRQIYGKTFRFKPYAKLNWATNTPPVFGDESDAVKMRLRVVEFPNTFRKNPDPSKGELPARDRRELEAELSAEIPGIINWMLEGLRRLANNGFKFSETKSTEDTWLFWQRRAGAVQCFIDECVEFEDAGENWITKDELFNAFKQWLKAVNVKLNISRAKFFRKLSEMGITSERRRVGDDFERGYWATVTVNGSQCSRCVKKKTALLGKNDENEDSGTTAKIDNYTKGYGKNLDTLGTPSKNHPSRVTVRFVVDLPYEMLDPDGGSWGPFERGQIAEVHPQLAVMWIRKGIAEPMNGGKEAQK